MKVETLKTTPFLSLDLHTLGTNILEVQKDSGEIPWSRGDKTDPWDMVEALMGLSIAGHYEAVRKGFLWLKGQQLENGAWYATYRNGIPEDRTMDTNMASYIATGLYHYWRITRDTAFLGNMWPALVKAMDFVLGLQKPEGEIWWARNPEGVADPTCLLTGSSSIFMSLKCANAIANIVGKSRPEWQGALLKLGFTIKNRRHVFDVSKSRYSMDWFYPVLCGALTDRDAKKHIREHWEKFVVEETGILCVSDQPWVTMAETSELVLALDAMGDKDLARIVFGWIMECRFEDGSFWCGFTHPDRIIWPEDRLTWTNAVVMMAADALYGITPAYNFFTHAFWAGNPHGVKTGSSRIHHAEQTFA